MSFHLPVQQAQNRACRMLTLRDMDQNFDLIALLCRGLLDQLGKTTDDGYRSGSMLRSATGRDLINGLLNSGHYCLEQTGPRVPSSVR